MGLKTLVKVGNISNLSDARYCSGMGVAMLGFTVVEGQQAFIPPKLFQEIRGWISGPSVVATLYGLNDDLSLQHIVLDDATDFLELDCHQLPLIHAFAIPLIVKINSMEDLTLIQSQMERVAYVQIAEKNKDIIEKIKRPVILELQSSVKIEDILNSTPVNGIALSGSPEVRPGYKDYGDLAEILEQLEAD